MNMIYIIFKVYSIFFMSFFEIVCAINMFINKENRLFAMIMTLLIAPILAYIIVK